MIRRFVTCGNGEIQLNLLEKCECGSDNSWQILDHTDGVFILAECFMCNALVKFEVVRTEIKTDDEIDELTRNLEINIGNF